MTVLAPTAVRVAEVVSPAPRAEWQALVDADPTAMADHSPAWTDAITACGPYLDVSRLYRFDDGRTAVLPLLRHRGRVGALHADASVPEGWGFGGLVGADRDEGSIRAVLEDLTGRRTVFTRIRPDPLDGERWARALPPGTVTRPRRAHVLRLDGDREALLAGLHKSTRRNLRKAERGGLDVTSTATPEHLAAYYGLYELSLRRWAAQSHEPAALATWRGRRRDPADKLAAMAAHLGDRFRLWLAWQDGEAIAGTIVLRGNAAHGTRGAMDKDRAGPSRAVTLLDWLSIEEALADGCSAFHFGESGTSASLARFKEGFGARSITYDDVRVERLPVTGADAALRTAVKRVIGFRDGS